MTAEDVEAGEILPHCRRAYTCLCTPYERAGCAWWQSGEPAGEILLRSRLRDARTQNGLTQGQVAGALGLSPSAISMYESGERGIDAGLLLRFSRLYQVDVGWLVGQQDAYLLNPLEDVPLADLLRTWSLLNEGQRMQVEQFARFLRGGER